MNIKITSIVLLFLCLSNSSCAQDKERLNTNEDEIGTTSEKASVVSVSVSGNTNNYNFSVGVSSPDTGCNQYANWWEVITEEGTLLYRRILGHSHVSE